jgi:hypothetical protein
MQYCVYRNRILSGSFERDNIQLIIVEEYFVFSLFEGTKILIHYN